VKSLAPAIDALKRKLLRFEVPVLLVLAAGLGCVWGFIGVAAEVGPVELAGSP